MIEKRLNTGDIEINYAVGPDNGPPLILIPGQGADWTTYEKVIPSLSEHYQVYAVDVRGHGKSDWATGNYTFNTIGADMTALLEEVVKKKAIISGNSSGGLIALWLAANRPELVRAIILEDPPLFSADWPRIKEDSYVYHILQQTVEMSRVLHESRDVRELARCFAKMKRPVKGGKVKKVPYFLAYLISYFIRRSQRRSGRPSLRGRLGEVIDVLWTFDADFSQAFVDGRIYEGLNHEDVVQRAKCPKILLHANWLRHPDFGLVGAMDDDDADYALKLAPDMKYKRIDADHVIHSREPDEFIQAVDEFVSQLPGDL
jgi:pimeloyl-ACP methyl ester carboxylesterase